MSAQAALAPAADALPARVTAALVGRQNAGKTSLLMHLTGTTQRPVNFPGSSVERGESDVRVDGAILRVVDLPGLASLVAMSPDEEVTLAYLAETGDGAPDVLCAVVDASRLAVELTLVTRLASLGKPVVVALNKLDVARANGLVVDAGGLSDALGVPVVATNAMTGAGADDLRRALLRSATLAVPRAVEGDPRDLARRFVRPLDATPDRAARRTVTERADRILLHRVWGLPILGLVMLALFQLLFTAAVPFMDAIDAAQGALAGLIEGALDPGALRSFLVDGLINGVGSIIIFLPQIAILMLAVALLEGTGYMARAAFLLDRPLSRVGLSGRSFVPLVSSFACAVPGILASRIIANERDRIATVVVSPLMSCSARLPVYVLLIGAFFPASVGGIALFAMYLLGIVTAALVAALIRRTALRGPASPLMMELPVYQRPAWRVVRAQVWTGCRDFLVLAGTVIFAAAVVIWLLSYYPRPAELHASFEAQRAVASEMAAGLEVEERLARIDAAEKAAYLEQSALAEIGRAVHPVFAPAGWDWRTSVGVLAAFPARELIIPTLGILYSLGEVDPGEFGVSTLGGDLDREHGLRGALVAAQHADGSPVFSPLVALSVMIFFALCSQCIGTLAAIRRETRSWRWPVFTFTYMTVLAWVAAVLVFQVGSALGFGTT